MKTPICGEPDSVTSIGEGAFRDCSGLTSVSLPKGLKGKMHDVFPDCRNLLEVTYRDAAAPAKKGTLKKK